MHCYEGNALRRAGYAADTGVFYLLQDHLHSSSATAAQTGTLAGARNYFYPFGGNRGGAAFNHLTAKRFTGQYHEATLPGGEGLSYYGARWYDAQLGRFTTPDSIVPNPADPQDLNRYTYVRNNPLKYTDPSGHCYRSIGDEDFACFYFAQKIYRTFPRLFYLPDLEKMNLERLQQVFEEAWEQTHVALPPEPLYKRAAKALAKSLLPDKGASAKGIAGSTGFVVDFPFNMILLAADDDGNLGSGAWSTGIGGSTGGNLDLGPYASFMPNASTIDAYVGDAVNTGISVGLPEVVAVAAEANVTRDPTTNKAITGLTVSLTGSLKANVPLPPVEFYGNWTRTSDFAYRINVYDWIDSWPD